MNTSRVEVLKTTGYEKTALKGSAKIWKAKRSVIIETKWQTKTQKQQETAKTKKRTSQKFWKQFQSNSLKPVNLNWKTLDKLKYAWPKS